MPAATSSTIPATADLLTLADWSPDAIAGVIATAHAIKADPESVQSAMAGRTLVMLFEKPSLRTRVSFEAGFARMGGSAIYLDHQATPIGHRESVGDYGRNLERWCDVIVARTFRHGTIEALASAASIPVVNALSDRFHPCQALADLMTLDEHLGGLAGARLAYVGDGNNVCHSLMLASAKLGISLTVIGPDGHHPAGEVTSLAHRIAQSTGAAIAVTTDRGAVAGHHAIYTDTWVSMGSEHEAALRRAALAPYRVDEALMATAGPGAVFMHCLPAHRGEEVTAGVIDSPQSVVFDQAENRMHAQNAVLLHLLGH